MHRKDVTQTSNHHRRRMSDKSQDNNVFSNTADRTHSVNVLSATGRPMRGGIRL